MTMFAGFLIIAAVFVTLATVAVTVADRLRARRNG